MTTFTSQQFPLTFRFKLIALASQFSVKNNQGKTVAYAKQQLFKLREAIRIYSDDSTNNQIYSINTNKILDFSANYVIRDEKETVLGSIRRRGMRSLYKADYEITDAGGKSLFTVREQSFITRLLDEILGDIPVLGMLTGYVFNPAYAIVRNDGTPVSVLRKQPALWEGVFELEAPTTSITDTEAALISLGCMMLVLLERDRG